MPSAQASVVHAELGGEGGDRTRGGVAVELRPPASGASSGRRPSSRLASVTVGSLPPSP